MVTETRQPVPRRIGGNKTANPLKVRGKCGLVVAVNSKGVL